MYLFTCAKVHPLLFHKLDAIADEPEGHPRLQQNEASADARDVKIDGIGKNVGVRNKRVAKLNGEGARSFQRDEVIVLNDFDALACAIDSRHDAMFGFSAEFENGAEVVVLPKI
jgi:hypothetical protein